MPRITQERRDQQRGRIIDAMLLAIQEHGIAQVSMAEVIERSGLSAGAIYGYFRGKDEILQAAAVRILKGRADALAELAGADPVPAPHEALRELLGALPDEALRGGAVLQIWGHAATHAELRGLTTEVKDAMVPSLEGYLRAWFRQSGRSDPAADARRSWPALMALAQGYIVQVGLLGATDLDQYVAAVGVLLGEGPAPSDSWPGGGDRS